MVNSKPIVSSKFNFHWKIKEFFLYLELNRNRLESPTFHIKCSEITKWCVSLIPTTGYVSCSLTRMQGMDDLSDILVNYKMYIVDGNGESHFEKENIKKLDHDVRTIEEPTFLEQTSFKPEYLANDSLDFRCEIVLVVDTELASNWNSNSDLISLSNDLLRLYETRDQSDMILNVGDAEFKVHKFVLSTRCSSIIATSASSLALSQCSEASQSSKASSNNSSENDSEESSSNSLIEDIEQFMQPVQLPVYCLDCDDSLMVEGGRYEHTFTIPVCEAILKYIYSGMVNATDSKLKSKLFTVGRHHNLVDLTNKLQDVEDEFFVQTEMISDRVSLLWDLSTYYDWSRYSFPTMTKFIHLSKQPHKLILCLRFSMVDIIEKGRLLYIFYKFTETEYPITVKLELVFYHTALEYFLRHLVYIETFWNDQQWNCAYIQQPVQLAYGSIYFFCTFTVCNRHESRIVRQCFSFSDKNAAQCTSLRQLSSDFTKSYCRPSNNNYYDLTLIPESGTVLAHKLVVYARSPVLRVELLPKMCQKDMIVHKVAETNLIVLRKVIEYMYKGLLLLKDFEHTEQLRETAEKFQITELVNACNTSTKEKLSDPIEKKTE